MTLVETLRNGEWDHHFESGPNKTGFCVPNHPAPKDAAEIIERLATSLRVLLDTPLGNVPSKQVILEASQVLAEAAA